MAVQDYLEQMDFTTLRKVILDMAPDDVDTTEGSFLYDAVTPIALFVSEMYNQMKLVLEQSFIGTATGSNLDILAATMPRIYRNRATAERLTLRLYPYSANIFGIIQSNYTTLKFTNESGEAFTCASDTDDWLTNDGTNIYVNVVKGITGKGTSYAGQKMEPSPAIDGLEVCEVYSINTRGNEVEDDDHFRVRVWTTMSSPFLGTVADYQRKVFSEFPLSENGYKIDNCFIIPRGSRSGYICVIPIKFDAETNAPEHCTSGELESLRDYLDKRIDGIGGYGFGVAPIGHVVKVTDFREFTMNFRVTIVVQNGASSQVIQSDAENVVQRATNDYLASVINEVVPSATNYRTDNKRYVNFYMHYYLNAHEYTVSDAAKNTFGKDVIKNILIEKIYITEVLGGEPSRDYMEQENVTIMSGDSYGCLPVLGELEVVITEEG